MTKRKKHLTQKNFTAVIYSTALKQTKPAAGAGFVFFTTVLGFDLPQNRPSENPRAAENGHDGRQKQKNVSDKA